MTKTILILSLLISITASAQQYSIDWHTIDGGGGTSTGGVFSVSGTIGQPDAGPAMSGGDFSLTGGFWSLLSVVQTPGAPLLSIEQSPGGVRVFWPATATGFVLEKSPALNSSPPATVWSLVPVAIYETNATQISITVSPAVGTTFYRLRKP
jgi:hypothetical protein